MVAVQTVRGPVDSATLGVLLPHEHLVSDISPSYAPSGDPGIDEMLSAPVGPELAWLLQDYPYNSRDNCRMDDQEAVLSELRHFRELGGSTVIDLTGAHEGRDPQALRQLSGESGTNIVMGSGWYLESSESLRMRTAPVDGLVDDLLRDFRETEIPPGVIGEIGVSPRFTAAEERTLRAAGICQRELKVPLFIHLPGWMRHGHRVLDIVLDEIGVDPAAVVLCHMDPSGEDAAYQRGLADRGAFLEFDMIGMPYWYRGAGEGQSPNPEQTALAITGLLAAGHQDQILVSHDMGIKSMLRKNGGHGLSYVPLLFPDRLIRLGSSPDIARHLMQDNPRRLFEAAAR